MSDGGDHDGDGGGGGALSASLEDSDAWETDDSGSDGSLCFGDTGLDMPEDFRIPPPATPSGPRDEFFAREPPLSVSAASGEEEDTLTSSVHFNDALACHEDTSSIYHCLEEEHFRLRASTLDQLLDIMEAIQERCDHDEEEVPHPCILPSLPHGYRFELLFHSVVHEGPHLIVPDRVEPPEDADSIDFDLDTETAITRFQENFHEIDPEELLSFVPTRYPPVPASTPLSSRLELLDLIEKDARQKTKACGSCRAFRALQRVKSCRD